MDIQNGMMDLPQLILIGLGAMVLIYFLLKVSKFFFKFFAVLFVVFVILYAVTGGDIINLKEESLVSLTSDLKEATIEEVFQETTIKEMEALCPPEEETDKCACIVEPVYQDLTNRLSKREIKRIDRDPELVKEQIKKSLYNQRAKIRRCLIKKNGSRFVNILDKVVDEIQAISEEEGGI